MRAKYLYVLTSMASRYYLVMSHVPPKLLSTKGVGSIPATKHSQFEPTISNQPTRKPQVSCNDASRLAKRSTGRGVPRRLVSPMPKGQDPLSASNRGA